MAEERTHKDGSRSFVNREADTRTIIDKRGNKITQHGNGRQDVEIRNWNPRKELCDD